MSGKVIKTVTVKPNLTNLKSKILQKRNSSVDPSKNSSLKKKSTLQNVASSLSFKYQPIASNQLYNKFKTPFQILPETEYQISTTNFFFNHSKVEFQWSISKFEEIPSEKYKKEMEEFNMKRNRRVDSSFANSSEFAQKEEVEEDEESEEDEEDEEEVEKVEEAGAEKYSHSSNFKLTSSKNFSLPPAHLKKPRISPDLLSTLPEIMFLGKCNVGKSSLLNSICTQLTQKASEEYAYSSKKAGFTTSINSFNIGNRFSLIDTPGYGKKSTANQGKEIIKYLEHRKELKKIYVLINSVHGFNENDIRLILGLLSSNGLNYGIVFTKIDKLKAVDQLEVIIKDFEQLMEENRVQVRPDYFFTSSVAKNGKRQGVLELRYDILNSCGLPVGVKPKRSR